MVRIIADTTSSIPTEEARRLGINYIPQIIIFGDESYRDDTEIDNKTFLTRLRTSSILPKTAAPPPELYKRIFEDITSKKESAVVICPSAEVSGTVRSATVAALDFQGVDIRILDTKTLGSGLASIVLQANEWAQQGMGIDTLVKNIEDMCARQRVYFLVDTLEYLHKGGRIGGAQALLGGLLQVKPILTLIDGKAQPVESQRTKQRALAKVIELVVTQYPKDQEGYLTIMHGDSLEEAKALAKTLADKLSLDARNIPIYNLPPAILVHAGPGVLAASFYTS
ncbi:MAG: DegV family protein [Anaerolineaceae bacterium]|nr:DegV family protein [Anaerolineaceae bacterium]